ncbi:hypothetical protein JG687_00010022 [Phytophthora cactorum]|uniref:Uncharacterized protein n=1 Tax=Phytophthora cactorum TaxID=29920 RepID=A0A8T1UAM5_9STRA|nr:hypothetical protein JG687_00010022 [Phytophthora cactorum]
MALAIEISLLKEEFPLARVFICHFHPKKYLRTEMSKQVYGGRDAVEVDRVEDAVDMMVKAQDETEYDWGLRYMSYLVDGVHEKYHFPLHFGGQATLACLLECADLCISGP